jgi:ASCH domain
VNIGAQLIGTRGLMVRDPYASQLLNGEKSWEIRGRATQIRGPIVIYKTGTGQAFGVVDLVDVIGPLSVGDLVGSSHLPSSEREDFRKTGLPYPKTFAYVVKNPPGLPRLFRIVTRPAR